MPRAAKIDAAAVVTVPTVTAAECLDVTPRRVRQLIDAEHLRTEGRDAVDVGWAIHWRIGENIARRNQWGDLPDLVLVAVGWLSALRRIEANTPNPGDVAVFVEAMTARGIREADTMRAVGHAEGLL